MTRSLLLGTALMLAIAVLADCLAIGGSDKTVTRPPTLGREFIDLKAALNDGAITEEEYNRAKAYLMREYRSLAATR